MNGELGKAFVGVFLGKCQPSAVILLLSQTIMGKKVKKCPKQCLKHAFLLKPVHYSAVFSRELSASYCPSSAGASLAAPAFNTDRRPFTPAFRLPSQLTKPCADEDYYREEQERRRLANETSQMLVAKPRGGEGYCSICKDNYNDYLQHINQESHGKVLRENRFNAYIDELAIQVDQQNKEEALEARLYRHNSDSMPLFHQESTCFEHHDYLNSEEGYRISQLFQSARNFHLLKEPVESIELQDEGSLFRRPSIHEKQTQTIIGGGLMSPVKAVLSLIISRPQLA